MGEHHWGHGPGRERPSVLQVEKKIPIRENTEKPSYGINESQLLKRQIATEEEIAPADLTRRVTWSVVNTGTHLHVHAEPGTPGQPPAPPVLTPATASLGSGGACDLLPTRRTQPTSSEVPPRGRALSPVSLCAPRGAGVLGSPRGQPPASSSRGAEAPSATAREELNATHDPGTVGGDHPRSSLR